MFSACQKMNMKNITLKTDDEKTLYTVGHMFGGRLKNLSLTSNEIEIILAGLRDSAQGKKEKVNIKTFQAKVQSFLKTKMSKSAEKNKVIGQKYLEKFLSTEKGLKTKSGLVYKILKEGTGKPPLATDTVTVHYHGTLVDKSVFDSSKDRGKEVTFPLNRVIKGWSEGLQLIGEGGQIKLLIPSSLAYGDQGAPPKIPGGETLTFIVDLLKITKSKQAPVKKELPKTTTK